MIEELIVGHSSPTLAGLKTANMFSCPFSSKEELLTEIDKCNTLLNNKGVELTILKISKEKALVYIYRPVKLINDLNNEKTRKLLSLYGYTNYSVKYCIDRLKCRFSTEKAFPHEIGVFLGYPIDDVIGFIENKGQGAKCTGFWKVYCNECAAIREFKKLEKCRRVYIKHFNKGKTIMHLTVAA